MLNFFYGLFYKFFGPVGVGVVILIIIMTVSFILAPYKLYSIDRKLGKIIKLLEKLQKK